MNFEQLQNAWSNEEGGPAIHEAPPQKPEHGDSLLAAVRRTMRRELWTQLGGYLLLIVLYGWFNKTALSSFVVCTIVLILGMQGLYFLLRFYRFYKRTVRLDTSLRRNLRTLTTELEVNLEIYRTFTLCTAPLATLAGIFVFAGPAITSALRYGSLHGLAIGWHFILWYLLNLIIFSAVIGFVLNLQLRWQYKKPLDALKRLLEELETDEA